MLVITFAEIKDGWAEAFFDFGSNQQIATCLSWFTDPFADLARLALAMLRGDEGGEVRFTDEETDWILRFQRQGNGFYTLRLENWILGSSISLRGRVTLKDHWETADVEPWQFAHEIWAELARVKQTPGVRSWNDDRKLSNSSMRHHSTAPCDPLFELARSLAGEDNPPA
ncbi:MAG: hypothetical protein CJBNEKGG_02563 [Prosthecobacter sp.]|nr:hypothetical protein [Prosthecobacter sp.]